MRKKFRPVFPLFLILTAFALAACGGSGDEDDPLDRELDLAMAEDSLAALADTTLAEAGEGEAPSEVPDDTPPPRRDPPPANPPGQTTPTPDPEPPPAPAYRDMSASAGTLLQVSLDRELSTESSNVGEKFTVTLLAPVTDATGVVIPAGTKIQGEVTALEPSGSAGQQAMIGRKSTEEKAVTIGAGAVVGGILGRVIGGNATGTIIGGVAGAAAGTAIALGTEDVDAVLEEGSEMTLRVEERITVRRPA
jgi:hypothetical protein